jgi:hypothetical protein
MAKGTARATPSEPECRHPRVKARQREAQRRVRAVAALRRRRGVQPPRPLDDLEAGAPPRQVQQDRQHARPPDPPPSSSPARARRLRSARSR